MHIPIHLRLLEGNLSLSCSNDFNAFIELVLCTNPHRVNEAAKDAASHGDSGGRFKPRC